MSMLKRVPTYWLFQLFGWGVFVLINMFFAYTLDSKLDIKFFDRVLIYVGLASFFTHMMRWVINRLHILIQANRAPDIWDLCLLLSFFRWS